MAGLGHSIDTSYTYAHPLEAEQHTPLTCSLDCFILSEIGESLVHCIELHHLVALVGCFGMLVSLFILGVFWHLDGLVIGGSLSGVGDYIQPRSNDCEGFCAFPDGAPKATLVHCLCH